MSQAWSSFFDRSFASGIQPLIRQIADSVPLIQPQNRKLLSISGLIFCALLGILPATTWAQGFRMVSGRNHPELKWNVASTQHFQIVYPTHLEGIAERAAPIAEASYEALSTNLGVSFDRRIRIYLSDEDEITNGFAVRIGNGFSNIWVHQNDPDPWTGPEKWLRHVIAHELTHIFHYRAVRSNAGWLQFLMANPLPRFWAEGLAQYETETWNAQRGDRTLRAAVLDDRLSYSDSRSLRNVQVLYALGNSQVRYFAEQYGDTSLQQLLAHRRPRLLGIFQVHDFGSALKSTIGKSYGEFYDDWRRHVNVYYNTLAGQMESIDSLHAESLPVPGQYVYDFQYSPDTSRIAMVTVPSARRPVRRLIVIDRQNKRSRVVAEGSIEVPVSWSSDGQFVAFSRLGRGEHGSMLNDIYVVDAARNKERRLTHSRRASSPSFSPDGSHLAFAGTEGGTANLFALDIGSGKETPLTSFTGDVQISHVRWAPSGTRIAFAMFDSEGNRDVMVVDSETGDVRPIAVGDADDRMPVWSPDGDRLAYTSLRDDVPNAFVYDFASRAHRRVTFLTTGASVTDWLPADSTWNDGSLVVIATTGRDRDEVYRISASRTANRSFAIAPRAYTEWTEHRPPAIVPTHLPPDADLITGQSRYSPWRNITHLASIAFPYIDSADDWGVWGVTSWVEPLGKHLFAAYGALSISDPTGHSYFLGTYVNNQLYPSIAFTGYRFPGTTRVYGDAVLVEEYAGGDVTVRWPLNWRARPYTRTSLGFRTRIAAFKPLNLAEISDDLLDLPPPERGEQADLTIGLLRKRVRPFADNIVHPIDGKGIRLMATISTPVFGTDREFVRGDLAGYVVLGERFLPALQRLFVYGRVQAQVGSPFPQDYLGFSKYDDVQLDIPGIERFLAGDAERVRGYRRYGLGNRLLFGSMEYRIPVFASLRTELFGVMRFGATTVAGFLDAGAVWTDSDLENADTRLGTGFEIKNALGIGGLFQISHALGWGWALVNDDSREVYYRVRMALPF